MESVMLSIELARIRQRHPHAAPELRFGLYTVLAAPQCRQWPTGAALHTSPNWNAVVAICAAAAADAAAPVHAPGRGDLLGELL